MQFIRRVAFSCALVGCALWFVPSRVEAQEEAGVRGDKESERDKRRRRRRARKDDEDKDEDRRSRRERRREMREEDDLDGPGEKNAADDLAVDAEEPSAVAPPSSKAILRWGQRPVQVLLGQTVETTRVTEPETESANVSKEKVDTRAWRFRYGTGFSALFDASIVMIGLGTEWRLELEIGYRHVISLLGSFGVLEEFIAGGGVGYSYIFEFVQDVFRIEVGAGLGYYIWESSHNVDGEDERYCAERDPYDNTNCLDWDYRYEEDYDKHYGRFGVLFIHPTMYLGKEWIFFTLSPRMIIGNGFSGGIVTGVTFRM